MKVIELENLPDVRINLKPNTRSRRITLRRSSRDGGFSVSYPSRAPFYEVEKFVRDHEGWIARHFKPVHFIDIGSEIPFRGEMLNIVEGEKRGVRFHGDDLLVKSSNPGRAISAALKSQASLYALDRLDHFAALAKSHVNEIRWRDPKTRWGSCDTKGNIMLSWRLVMTPDWVFDYVIAHEVAHLIHMDHSHRFWNVVEEIYPEHMRARSYLKREGAKIQSILFDKT